MLRVKLCEFCVEGHSKVYFSSLLKIRGTELRLKEYKLLSIKKNPFLYLKKVYEIIKYFLENSFNEKIIFHILSIDKFINYPFIFKLFNKKTRVLVTLHHVPRNKIKLLSLKNLSKKVNIIVVHSKFLKEQLLSYGIKNIEVINYPSFYSYNLLYKEKIKSKYNFNKNKVIVTLLGGTRQDKGLNILLESLKYLGFSTKEKLIINIAGKEEFFKKSYIENYKKEVEIKINLKLLSDEEFIENVFISDIMIMPYLKSFGGNSGPMTEAIVNKIPCIVPKELNIGKIVSENNLGETFECENPKDLARAIEKMINNMDLYYTTDFYKTLTEENFIKNYEKIYKKLWKEVENE